MQSNWYQIAQAVGAQCKAAAATSSAGYMDNPPLPLDIQSVQRERALFMLQRGDRALEQPGQRNEKRVVRIVVGALALTSDSLADADALHFAARTALRSEAFRAQLRAITSVGAVREVEVEAELKDMVTEGSALMSAFEIEYFQSYPNAA